MSTKEFDIKINGKTCSAEAGETVFEVAAREGIPIPTLCHDTRLEPAGACRVCLVEVKGQRRLEPGCAWKVSEGTEVTTESDRIERHRKVLYGLYLADHKLDEEGLPVETANINQLRMLARETDPIRLHPVEAKRAGRPDDVNPYIAFDPDLCILCARCTR